MRLVLIIHLSRRRPSLSHGLKVCPVSVCLQYESINAFAGLQGSGLAAGCSASWAKMAVAVM